MIGLGRKKSEIAIGTRYRDKAAPHVVWDFLATYVGFDGRSYAGLFNLGDPTWQKTLSLAEVVDGHHYSRLDHK
jgi:hypothetical protein